MAQRAIRGAECESVLQQVDALIKLRAHQGALDHRLAERSPLFGEVRRFGNGPPGCRAILAPLRLQEQVAPCQTLSFLRKKAHFEGLVAIPIESHGYSRRKYSSGANRFSSTCCPARPCIRNHGGPS